MTPLAGLRFEGPGEVLRRRGSLLVGAAVLFVTSLVLGAMGVPGWGPLVEQGMAVWLLVAFAVNAYAVTRRGEVRADATGLSIGSERIVERSAIAAAFLRSPEDPMVRIVRRRGPPIDVKLESEEKARALLTALGTGLGESIATFSAFHGGRTRFRAVAVAAAAGAGAVGASSALLHGGARTWALWMVPLAVPVAVILSLRYFARVDVGGDGVLLRRLGEQRFVSYRDIAGVDAHAGTLTLTLRSGETLPLTIRGSRELCDALVQRIAEARESFAPDDEGGGAEALLAPGGRAVDRWLSDVKDLAAARTYRETRLDEERLWRMVDDPTASPATRAAAGLALSVIDQPSRVRLRVAAEACAEPKLRVALTRVAEGATDAELEDAMAPLLESRRSST